jgi:prepilin-type N-terminal cleavage/methylation domain-containing protein
MKTMSNSKGFTMIEIIIVMALMTIMATIAIPAWQNYITNTNLKSATRQLMADIMNTRHRAIAENINTYRITLNTAGNNYSLSRTDTGTTLWTKPLESFGDSNSFHSVDLSGDSFINFQRRGTVTVGEIILKNKIDSRATIRVQLTGRTYAQYDLQK